MPWPPMACNTDILSKTTKKSYKKVLHIVRPYQLFAVFIDFCFDSLNLILKTEVDDL